MSIFSLWGCLCCGGGVRQGRRVSRRRRRRRSRADAVPAAADVGVRVARARGRHRPVAMPLARQMRPAPGGVGSTSETGCPANRGANVRVNQNCLNLTDPDLQGRGQAQNETAIAQRPDEPQPHRRLAERLPPRRRQLLRRVPPRRRPHLDGLDAADRLHPRGRRSAASRASTGRRAATPRWPGTRRATPTCRARCSTAARPCRNNPDQSSAFYVFRSTGNGGASWNFPARPVAEHNDIAGAGDGAARQAVHDGRQPPGQPVPGPRLRHLDVVRRRRHRATSTRRTRTTTASTFSAPVLVSTRQRALLRTRSAPDAAGHAATRTSSRSRSPAPTGRCTWCGTTTTTGVRPGEGDDDGGDDGAHPRGAAGRRQPQPGAAGQVDRRRRRRSAPGEGGRLLRPARLRDLPERRRPGPGVRARRRARRPTRSSGRPTTRRAPSTRTIRRRWS